jgi:peptide/nickel transport system permease protein
VKRLLPPARAVGRGVVTLVTISLVTFVAMNYRSADEVARNALGREAAPAQLRAYAKEHGLDTPLWERYGRWVSGVARGDLGVSAVTRRPVAEDAGPRLRRSLILGTVALLLSLPVAVGLGTFMAKRAGKKRDVGLLSGLIALAALPEFVVGITLLLLFSVLLQWLPVESATAFTFGTTGERVTAYVMPVLAVMLVIVPYLARFARASVHETLAAPYVRSATLRGLSRGIVFWDHAFRNAAIPLVNATALMAVYALTSLVVIENVFSFPGIGQFLVEAIANGDTVTVEAVTLVFGACIVVVNLLADLLVVYLNPRLRAST